MPDLLHYIPINAGVKRVYGGVATQEGMRGWWTRDCTMESRPGCKAEFGFVKRAVVFRMIIDTLEPVAAVRMASTGDQPEWTGTRLEQMIESTADGSALHFCHGRQKAVTAYAIGCNSTWGELMYRLKIFAETGRPDPHWID